MPTYKVKLHGLDPYTVTNPPDGWYEAILGQPDTEYVTTLSPCPRCNDTGLVQVGTGNDYVNLSRCDCEYGQACLLAPAKGTTLRVHRDWWKPVNLYAPGSFAWALHEVSEGRKVRRRHDTRLMLQILGDEVLCALHRNDLRANDWEVIG